MNLELDSRNRKQVKFCPCKKSNNDGKFVPFKDHSLYGYCHSCNETFFPNENRPLLKPEAKPEPKKEYLNKNYYKSLLFDYDDDRNNFVDFVTSKIGVVPTDKIIVKYLLGTSAKKDRAVIFPIIDTEGNIISLKHMQYNATTGRRTDFIYYEHPKNRHPLCLFGLHLLKSDPLNRIAIVESEKTACLMSYFHPSFTWLACGGSNGVHERKLRELRGRKVILFPDHNKYDEWLEKANSMNKNLSTVSIEVSKDCELWYNEGKLQKGGDIADYYLSLT
jgi:hypothetical protein|tara:strand:- start:176 stop:1006 length:831 start_codon:yes stop_codon:yes gene_type:complete